MCDPLLCGPFTWVSEVLSRASREAPGFPLMRAHWGLPEIPLPFIFLGRALAEAIRAVTGGLLCPDPPSCTLGSPVSPAAHLFSFCHTLSPVVRETWGHHRVNTRQTGHCR